MASDDRTLSETDVADDEDLGVAATEVSGARNKGEDAGDLVGKKVDRYQVIARLGAGGMGVVYAAHDPALDRKVALKVLPPLDRDRGSHLEARLRREAQALARLDHPNVIGVYDVGVAEHSVFIAMRLVDGTTLDDHLAEAKPPPRAILALFLAVGRGLAAAHAAGIVHRDVKPSNVLVDRSGGVYVGDFGLARGAGDDEVATPVNASLLDESLTRAGAVVGTPLYMAPEQHRGEPATAASDQFSYCVSLWQALFDDHPFHHGPWVSAKVLAAMAQDRVREPASGRGIPPSVIRALRRGLRHDPAERWPSMDALLAVLTPRSRAAWVYGGLAVAGIAGAVALTAMVTSGGGEDRRAACRRGAERIAEVWPRRAPTLEAAIAGSGLPEAAGTATRVTTALTGYTGRLHALRLETCDAADVRGDLTPALRDLQLRCLDDDLAVTDALITDLERGDRRLHARAIDSVASLPRLEDCSTHALASLPPPPSGDLIRISQLTADLARVKTLVDTDRVVEADPISAAAVTEAEAIGYEPLLAHALYNRARVLHDLSAPEARAFAERAAEVATVARADRWSSSAYSLALLIAAIEPDLRAIETLTPVARAAAKRTEDPILYAMYATAAGQGASSSARYDDAIALCTEAEEATRDIPEAASTTPLECLVQANLSKGDIESAGRWAEAAVARAEQAYGRGAPGTVGPMRRLAAVRRRQGRVDDALALYQEALAIDERAFGTDNPDYVSGLIQLAQIMHQTQRFDVGLEMATRALAAVQRFEPTPGMTTVNAHTTLAQLLRGAGRREEMYVHYRTALDLAVEVLAPDDANLATIRYSYGNALSEDARYDEALVQLALSGDALTRIGSPRAVLADASRAEILQAQGRCAEAVPVFERVATSMAASGTDASNLVYVRFNLADCLWQSKLDRPRARTLMTEVRAAAVAMGEMQAFVAECDAWLRQHR